MGEPTHDEWRGPPDAADPWRLAVHIYGGALCHLSPDHLRSAVEKLGAPTLRLEATASPVSQSEARPEPRRAPELDSNLTRLQDEASRAS